MKESAENEVRQLYGRKLRLRVCGICLSNDRILMIRHSGVVENEDFWSPPGGGLQFGETAHEALIREFKEETNLEIEVGKLLFVNEFLGPPLHAIELFFQVNCLNNDMVRGYDPEMKNQIIEEIRWMTWEEIKAIKAQNLHRIFSLVNSFEEFSHLDNFLGQNHQ